jgi:hypothetical protein
MLSYSAPKSNVFLFVLYLVDIFSQSVSRFDNCFFCSIDDVTIKQWLLITFKDRKKREEQIECLVHLLYYYLIISTTPYTNTFAHWKSFNLFHKFTISSLTRKRFFPLLHAYMKLYIDTMLNKGRAIDKKWQSDLYWYKAILFVFLTQETKKMSMTSFFTNATMYYR